MELSHQGIYWKLKSRETPWEDKVKLARYCWKYDNVFIPNKHQAILDWLCLALTGKQRVPASEAGKVWQCLHDILQTCFHQSNKLQNPLVLKSSMCQVLLDEVQAVANDKPRHCNSDDVIISCCYLVVSSPSLGHVLTSKFEHMLSLVASLSQICTRDLLLGNHISNMKLDFLDTLIQKYDVTHRLKSNTHQTVQAVGSKLFSLAVCFIDVIQLKCQKGDRLYSIGETLRNLILKSIFPMDVMSNYIMYLKLKTSGEGSKSTPARFIDSILCQFSIISQQKKQDDPGRDALQRFLPVFFEGFVKAYRSEKNDVGFQLLTYMCVNVLNIFLTEVAEKSQAKISTNDSLTVLHQLLVLVGTLDVYNLADDLTNDNAQLNWFKKLTDWVLDLEDRSAVWFECLRELLRLNHALIEPKLLKVLRQAGVNVTQTAADAVTSHDALLTDIIDTYQKLRQIHKLVARLLQVLGEAPGEDLALPKGCAERLCCCVTALSQGMCVEIWKLILKEIRSHLEDDNCPASLGSTCSLFSLFLMNIKVADYSITIPVASQVDELMEQTKSFILQPLLNKLKSLDTSVIVGMTELLYSWRELRILLRQYGRYGGVQPREGIAVDVMSLPASSWDKVLHRARKKKHPKFTFIVIALHLQKLKGHLFEVNTTNEADHVAILQGCIEFAMEQFKQKETLVQETTWNGQFCTIETSNLPIAVWERLCDTLPLVIGLCSRETTQELADILVWSLAVLEKSGISSCADHITMSGLSQKVIASDTVWECRSLQSAILTSVFIRMGNLLDKKARSSPKKKQKTESSIRLADIVTSLGDEVFTTTKDKEKDESSGSVQLLQQICGNLKQLLNDLPDTHATFSQSKCEPIHSLLKCIDMLPLEYMSQIDQNRIIVAGLVVQILTKSHPDLAMSRDIDELRAANHRLLKVVLDSLRGSSQLLTWLDTGTLTTWLMSLPKGRDQKIGKEAFGSDLIKLVFWHASKDVSNLQQMHPVIQTAMKKVKSVAKGSKSIEHLDSSTLQVLVHSLQCFSRLLTRTNLKDDMRSFCDKNQTVILPMFLELTRMTFTSTDTSPAANLSHIITAYGVCTEYIIKGDSSVHMTTWRELLPLVSRGLLEVLARPGVDLDTLASTIRLVDIFCRYIEKIREHLPQDFMRSVWTNFVQKLEEINVTSIISKEKVLDEDVAIKQDQFTVMHNEMDTNETLINSHNNRLNCDHNNDFLSGKKNDLFPSNHHKVRSDTEEVLAAIAGVLTEAELTGISQALIDNLSIENLESQIVKVEVALGVWRRILDRESSKSTKTALAHSAQTLLVKIQELLLYCGTSCDYESQYRGVVALLETQTKLLSSGPGVLSPSSVSVCLHACQNTPLRWSSLTRYGAVFHGVYNVLNEMLVQHSDTVLNVIPAFISAATYLMKSIIEEGRQRETPLSDSDVATLVNCALLIDRLFCLVRTYKVEFGKVAVYVVADYVSEVQKFTLLPQVKRALLPAIYHMLDLCDYHSVALLHTALNSAVKPIFQTLYDDYIKYHKYTGKV